MLRWFSALPLLLIVACSAVVGGPIDPGAPIRCEIVDGVDPCPERSSCVDSFCTITFDTCNGIDDDADGITDEGSAVAPACDGEARCVDGSCLTGCSNEVCNGEDDDCDGMADEGLDVDNDMDRVSACPTNDDPPDCDDSNSSVHPGSPTLGFPAAMEVCNGLDDDCDPGTGESDVGSVCPVGSVCQRLPGAASPMCFELDDCRLIICPGNEVCDTVTRRCAAPPPDCNVVGQECPAPLVCNATGMCEPPPLALIGGDCDEDAECASKLCMPRAAMRLPPGDHTGICGRACCADDECGAGERCWAPGTGARSCVTAAVYGDAAIELCSAASDCDGSCRTGSVTYTAGGLEQSFAGMMCMGSVFGGSGAYCPDTALGRIPCSNGTCLTDLETCANPCGSTADCAPQYPDFFPFTDYTPVCNYLIRGDSIFTACVPPLTTGVGTTGTACTGNGNCRDAFCVSGRCADVCCNDESCPGGYRCAPIHATIGPDEVWPMRCVPDGMLPE